MDRITVSAGAARTFAAALGGAVTLCALALIWMARSQVDRPVYVSELGADGEPTAQLFELALLLVVAGGLLVAWAGRGIRATPPVLRAWSVSTSVTAAAALFLVASQVPCTAGCPLPVGATFSWQDLVHTSAAVLAFAAASLAMLQASLADGGRALRLLSLTCGIAVAVIAGTGGILSLLRFATDIGGFLELLATTIAIGWLVVFAGAARGVETVSVRPRAALRATAQGSR
ncbi:DUF998 domain-containing protein [Clavibacter michiganensis]|nr:DUF998 domain-containing protein [Clavibacter michiganensis]